MARRLLIAGGVLVGILLVVVVSAKQLEPIPAFPEAEGFGMYAVGGRGGRVIEVTNLNDSGDGSLRAAINANEPRIVVFRVGGEIVVTDTLVIEHPYITIAGQSAPGDGITIRNTSDNARRPLKIETHDVIIRYLRVRPGPSEQLTDDLDAIGISGGYNVILDHISAGWGTDEIMTIRSNSHDVSVQWSIFAEGLNDSTHIDGPESKGVMFSDGSERISFHHNLLAHNGERNPRVQDTGVIDVVNTIVYDNVFNNGWGPSHVTNDVTGMLPINYVGNFYQAGVHSGSADWLISTDGDAAIFVEGNITPLRPNNALSETVGVVRPSDWEWVVGSQHPVSPVVASNAFVAREAVLSHSGASCVRDAVDQRIVNDVINGTGGLIDYPDEVGGWPPLAGGMPPPDSDQDGMPDGWEVEQGLNPNDPDDGSADLDGDGYTNLEEYLNTICIQPHIPPPTINTFAPSSGTFDTTIVLTGSDLLSVTKVAFNGTEAISWTIDSATQIRAVVPFSATTGAIGVTNATGTFLTQPFNVEAHLVGAGDIAGCAYNTDESTAQLLDILDGRVFTLGDNAFESGSQTEYDNCYLPTWGRHLTRTRPAIGDTDYATGSAAGFESTFGSETYYSYDWGDWHIIVLNSVCAEVGGCEHNSPQGQWLQADLAANPSACTLAMWHQPRFSSGVGGGSSISAFGEFSPLADFWRILYEAGVDVILNAGDRHYERFHPQDHNGNPDSEFGIRQFIVGTGGYPLDALGMMHPNSAIANADTHGMLQLTLRSADYIWQFHPIAGQTFNDSGQADCNLSSPLNQPPQLNAGPDQTVPFDVPIRMNGSVTDDGLPNPPNTVALQWQGESSDVKIASPARVDPTVIFEEIGVYELLFSADDGVFVITDTVTISVTANQPPQVDAGQAQTITLPSDTVLLNGTVSDDGLPEPPNQITTLWQAGAGVTFADPTDLDTSATFAQVGTYAVQLTADDSQFVSSDVVTITVLPEPQFDVLEVRISADNDDAEEEQDGNMQLSSSDLEMILDGGPQVVGLRFDSVSLPEDATVINATIQFTADETDAIATDLTIWAERSPVAQPFVENDFDISDRPKTNASVVWSPPAWNAVGQAGAGQRTPNLAPLIEEVINLSGWTSGDPLVFIIDGSGKRVADSHDSAPNEAALLHIEYTLTVPTNIAFQNQTAQYEYLIVPFLLVFTLLTLLIWRSYTDVFQS